MTDGAVSTEPLSSPSITSTVPSARSRPVPETIVTLRPASSPDSPLKRPSTTCCLRRWLTEKSVSTAPVVNPNSPARTQRAVHVGGLQELLGRHAPAVQARPAHLLALHDRDVEPCRGAVEGRGVPAGPPADDDDVVARLLRGHAGPSRSDLRPIRRQPTDLDSRPEAAQPAGRPRHGPPPRSRACRRGRSSRSPEWPFTHENATSRPAASASVEQPLPQVAVCDRLALRVLPPARAPPHVPPVAEAVDDVRRVAHDLDRVVAGWSRSASSDRGDLHALVRGGSRRTPTRTRRGRRPTPSPQARGCPGTPRRCGPSSGSARLPGVGVLRELGHDPGSEPAATCSSDTCSSRFRSYARTATQTSPRGGRRPVVGERLGAQAAHARHRAADRPQRVGDRDLRGRPGELVAAL